MKGKKLIAVLILSSLFCINAAAQEELSPQENAEQGETTEQISEETSTLLAENEVYPDAENIFEFEDFATQYVTDDAHASVGKMVSTMWGEQTNETIAFTVFAAEAGEYSVLLSANQYNQHKDNISYWNFYINDEEVYNIQSTSTKMPWATDDDVLTMAEFYGVKVLLKEGENTIKFVAKPCSAASGGRIKMAVDYVMLYKPIELEGFTASLEGTVVKGDEIKPTIMSKDGKLLNEKQYSSITYTTKTPEYIKIENGKLYARNYGSDIVTITISRDGESYTATFPVSIAAANGLYIASASRSGNKINFTVSAGKAYSSGAYAVIAVYDTKNGLKTLMSCYNQLAMEPLAAGEEKNYEETMDEIPENAYINIFLYDGKMSTYRVVGVTNDVK